MTPLWFWDEDYWDTFEGAKVWWNAMLYSKIGSAVRQRKDFGLAALIPASDRE